MKLSLLALVATWLALVAPAAAKPMYTPPASIGTGAAVHYVVHNLGAKPRTLAVELRDAMGGVLVGVSNVTVQPGTFQAPVGYVGPTTGVSCVFEGLSRTVRGYLRVTADGTTHTMLPATR